MNVPGDSRWLLWLQTGKVTAVETSKIQGFVNHTRSYILPRVSFFVQSLDARRFSRSGVVSKEMDLQD